jgi:hypothetical protein
MPKNTILGETLSFQKKEEKKGGNLLIEVLLNRQTLPTSLTEAICTLTDKTRWHPIPNP